MPPRLNTCAPWAVLEDLPDACNDVQAELGAEWLQIASDILFQFTGRRWPGVCTSTVRPYSCACQVGSCGCGAAIQIDLPDRPVVVVSQVKIDGDVIDPSYYQLQSDRWLVYLPDEVPLGGRRGFPTSQRLDRADSEENTFSVTYTHGTAPPDGGATITGLLACELMKSARGDLDDCQLPERVTAVTRQGVTMALIDPLDLFEDGRTGVPLVDMWVAAQNRQRTAGRASVHVPGSGAKRRQDRFRRI